ncbi:hypothetical protein CEXT_567801 [Caerostris extrusa]|uniref:Uncharacterized protein n=1 Tax=Caerostris extrusa TaxID=172846 RepID=A0AAV4T1G6_CAEEX|nr:hypothetical protein CEXT_567801 [Caerostris extrusa]
MLEKSLTYTMNRSEATVELPLPAVNCEISVQPGEARNKQLREMLCREDLLLQIDVRDPLSMVMKISTARRSQTDLPTSLGRTQEKYAYELFSPLLFLLAGKEAEIVLIPLETEDLSLKSLTSSLEEEATKKEEMASLTHYCLWRQLEPQEKKKKELLQKSRLEYFPRLHWISVTNQRNSDKQNFNCLPCDETNLRTGMFYGLEVLEKKKKRW